MPGPDRDLQLLTETLQEAGEIAMRHWRRSPKAWDKPDGAGPVTEADLAVNNLMARRLQAARPGYGWLSEESADGPERLLRQRVFIVDPIDGTRSFMAGEDTFALVAGVAEAGQMIAGAVWLPALKRLYSAHRDGPALMNGQEIRVSCKTDLAGATMLTSAANLQPQHWPGGVPAVRRAFRPSLAYRLALVAEGRHDSMAVFRGTWEWDIAAASLIVERAGGLVTAAKGGALRFNAPVPRVDGVMAANPALHHALVSRTTSGS